MCTVTLGLGLSPWAMAGKHYTVSNISDGPWYLLVAKESTGKLTYMGHTGSTPPSSLSSPCVFKGTIPEAPDAKQVFVIEKKVTAVFDFGSDDGTDREHVIIFYAYDKNRENGGTQFIDEVKEPKGGKGFWERRGIRREKDTRTEGLPGNCTAVQICETTQNILFGLSEWANFYSWRDDSRAVASRSALKLQADTFDSLGSMLDLGSAAVSPSGLDDFSWKAPDPRGRAKSSQRVLEGLFDRLAAGDCTGGAAPSAAQSKPVAPEGQERKTPGAEAGDGLG
jgi:hypothetical protein